MGSSLKRARKTRGGVGGGGALAKKTIPMCIFSIGERSGMGGGLPSRSGEDGRHRPIRKNHQEEGRKVFLLLRPASEGRIAQLGGG